MTLSHQGALNLLSPLLENLEPEVLRHALILVSSAGTSVCPYRSLPRTLSLARLMQAELWILFSRNALQQLSQSRLVNTYDP